MVHVLRPTQTLHHRLQMSKCPAHIYESSSVDKTDVSVLIFQSENRSGHTPESCSCHTEFARCDASVSPSPFYYGAAPCPFSPAPCPFPTAPCPFSESTFCALHFGKKFIKIGQKIRKLQEFLLEVCRDKFGKIYDHDFHSC